MWKIKIDRIGNMIKIERLQRQGGCSNYRINVSKIKFNRQDESCDNCYTDLKGV